MQIGLQIPSFTFPGGPGEIRQHLAEIARCAEAQGFASLWVMDHFFQIEFMGDAEQEMLEGYSTLSYLAALTERAYYFAHLVERQQVVGGPYPMLRGLQDHWLIFAFAH